MKGSYVLIIETPNRVEVGSLGNKIFQQEYAVYIGSAFGPGGLKRVLRHFSSEKKIHWHIDYLLEKGKLKKALLFPEKDIECNLAKLLNGEPVQGFGCSDCECGSHLLQYKNSEKILGELSVFSDIKVINRARYNQYQSNKRQKSIDELIGDLPNPKSYQE